MKRLSEEEKERLRQEIDLDGLKFRQDMVNRASERRTLLVILAIFPGAIIYIPLLVMAFSTKPIYVGFIILLITKILVILHLLRRSGYLPTKCPDCWHLLHKTGIEHTKIFDSREKTLHEYGCRHCKYKEWRVYGFKKCLKCGGKWVLGIKSRPPYQKDMPRHVQWYDEQECIQCGHIVRRAIGFSSGGGAGGGCGGCGG